MFYVFIEICVDSFFFQLRMRSVSGHQAHHFIRCIRFPFPFPFVSVRCVCCSFVVRCEHQLSILSDLLASLPTVLSDPTDPALLDHIARIRAKFKQFLVSSGCHSFFLQQNQNNTQTDSKPDSSSSFASSSSSASSTASSSSSSSSVPIAGVSAHQLNF